MRIETCTLFNKRFESTFKFKTPVDFAIFAFEVETFWCLFMALQQHWS